MQLSLDSTLLCYVSVLQQLYILFEQTTRPSTRMEQQSGCGGVPIQTGQAGCKSEGNTHLFHLTGRLEAWNFRCIETTLHQHTRGNLRLHEVGFLLDCLFLNYVLMCAWRPTHAAFLVVWSLRNPSVYGQHVRMWSSRVWTNDKLPVLVHEDVNECSCAQTYNSFVIRRRACGSTALIGS